MFAAITNQCAAALQACPVPSVLDMMECQFSTALLCQPSAEPFCALCAMFKALYCIVTDEAITSYVANCFLTHEKTSELMPSSVRCLLAIKGYSERTMHLRAIVRVLSQSPCSSAYSFACCLVTLPISHSRQEAPLPCINQASEHPSSFRGSEVKTIRSHQSDSLSVVWPSPL